MSPATPEREAPCRHCGSDWHYTDEHESESACAACGVPLPTDEAAAKHLVEALGIEMTFDITNACFDPSHPFGVHRHGAARFVRETT